MTFVCTICSHPSKLDMDRALAEGKTLAAIGRQWGVSTEALRNHRDNHLTRQMVKAVQTREAINHLNILSNIDDLITRTKSILDEAESNKNYGLALAAINSARGTYELLCKIAIALHDTRREELDAEQWAQDVEDQQQARKLLQVLTTAELSMYSKLVDKIHNQTHNIIIPDNDYDWHKYKNTYKDTPKGTPRTVPMS